MSSPSTLSQWAVCDYRHVRQTTSHAFDFSCFDFQDERFGTGFLKFVDYMWRYKYRYSEILYDKYAEYDIKLPADDAQLAAFNLHISTKEPLYAIFTRNTKKDIRDDSPQWFFHQICNPKVEEDLNEKLKISHDVSPGPKSLIVKSNFHTADTRRNSHYYDNLNRLTEDSRNIIIQQKGSINDMILSRVIHKNVFGCSDKIAKIEEIIPFFDENLILYKWYVEAPKSGRLNPINDITLLYPIKISTDVDAVLVIEESFNLRGKTIYSLRQAYRNALLIHSDELEHTWLNRGSVNNSITRGSTD